jgi:hypothetical protein
MTKKNQPVNEIKSGMIRATLWCNESSDSNDPWYSVTVSRLYKGDEDTWRSSNTFRKKDLPLLGKVIDDAYNWIGLNTKSESFIEPLQDEIISLKTKGRRKKPTKKKAK